MTARPLQRIARGLSRRIRTRVFALGGTVRCPFCDWSGFRFLPAGAARQANRLCPRCGSLQRYRALKLYLDPILTQGGGANVCEIAPKPCFRHWCKGLPGVRYVGVDLASAGADVLSDLTRFSFQDASFDVVVCMHVLEHIEKDREAMSEICRVLRPGGFALIMVPLRGESTLEIPDLPLQDREEVFGQADHVRYYGQDIAHRLRTAGGEVDVIDILETFSDGVIRHRALKGDDRYLFRVSPASPVGLHAR